MDSLDKHVKQISFRQCITFREHGQLKGWQPHFQPTDAKISILSISTIVHWISLVCSSHVSQLRAQSIPCNPNLGHNHCIVSNKSWRPQLRDQTLCFSDLSAWDSFFSAAATKGWAWYKHNAELVEHTAALRSLKLLVGSGCLEFQNGMAGMDPETNMSSHGANICSWNTHSPVSNPWRLKALSAVVTEEHNQYIVHKTFGRPQLCDQTLCFSAWDRFSSATTNLGMMQKCGVGGACCGSQGSGCLEFRKRMARMDSLDKHVVTCCEHLQPKGSQTRFQPTEAKSWISTILHWLSAVWYIWQPRSQSMSCNPHLGYLDSIFCKHDATIMQSWWSVLRLSAASIFW